MEFNINKTYQFFTLAPTILGGEHKNMKVLAIMTADQAISYQDIVTQHSSLLSVIPVLPKSVSDCTFILFQNVDGEKIVLANEYIDQNSIVETVTTNIRVEILDVNLQDVAVIRNRFIELGYVKANITTF